VIWVGVNLLKQWECRAYLFSLPTQAQYAELFDLVIFQKFKRGHDLNIPSLDGSWIFAIIKKRFLP
jgi:hypothetical protein